MMETKVFVFIWRMAFVFYLVPICGYAGKEVKYPLNDIPVPLIKNSNSVVRLEQTTFEVINIAKAALKVKRVITLFNKKADDLAEITVGYDKHISIGQISASIYNANGVEVKKLKNSDIKDFSSFQDFSIFEDNRVKYFELNYPDYPYTIEVEYNMVFDGILFYPDWMPQTAFSQSIEKSVFEVKLPLGQELRYKEFNMPSSVVKTEMGKQVHYRWEADQMEAIKREPMMPYLSEILPLVRTSPAVFKYDGYEGDMSSWNTIAQFQNTLNVGRRELPEATRQKTNNLVKDETTDREKVRLIYQYLQDNTRYISVQLGIGGWQPFSAEFVDEMGYGDCKALSNYMQAMLESVGIKSHYTLVRAGRNTRNIDKTFPHDQFNHVILCVPNQGDTLWLECTSQDNPFGYTGRFTGDRDVLVCTEDGGKIVHTPVFTKENNLLDQVAEIDILMDGNARARLKAYFCGLQYDPLSGVSDLGMEKQKKTLYNLLDIPSFEIEEFTVEEHKRPIPTAELDAVLNLRRFASVSGKRIFFKPNLLNRRSSISKVQEERNYDMVVKYAYTDLDTMIYRVPDSYHLEFIPEGLEIDTKFGQYKVEVMVEQGKLTYIRKMVMNQGRYAAEEYEEYVEFINKVAEGDNMKLVLVKST